MEKIVRLVEQGALTSRNWTNRNGETVVINSVELKLRCGSDEFVAEASDNLAQSINAHSLSSDTLYVVKANVSVHEWQSKETGKTVRTTRIRLTNLQEI